MKENQFIKWESARAKGKLHFILVRGVLSWGLPMFIFMAFINKPFAYGFTSEAAAIHYIVWPIAGVLFGLFTWYLSERLYQKELTRRGNT